METQQTRVDLAVEIDERFKNYLLEMTFEEIVEMAGRAKASPLPPGQRGKFISQVHALISPSVLPTFKGVHQKYQIGREQGQRVFFIRMSRAHFPKDHSFAELYEKLEAIGKPFGAVFRVEDDGLSIQVQYWVHGPQQGEENDSTAVTR